MIPPAFVAKNKSSHQIGIKGAATIIDKGDEGEAIVYNLLKQLGSLKQIGMFVVHGFQLKDLKQWNKHGANFLFDIPVNGEFDFIIFHHALGIISLEVKNYDSNIEKAVQGALRQLKVCKRLMETFATYDTAGNSDIHLLTRKVFAMPSTKRCESDVHVGDDILLLFEEDCQSIDAFLKWWQEMVETPTRLPGTQEMQDAYEKALSFTLMIRHLHAVTEPEYIIDVFHESLSGYTCHKYAAYQQLLENEFPKFWDWCWRVLNKKDENYDFGDGDAKELKKVFMKSHQIKSLKDLSEMKGVSCIDKLLKNSNSDYISGNMPSTIDEVLADLYAENFFLFHENILKFINKMRMMQTHVVECGPIDDFALLERCPFLKLESYQDLNRLDRHFAKNSLVHGTTHAFIHGDKPSIADLQLFETLTCQMTVKRNCLPMVLTTDQLAVFEGPLKQLIIGPPGSGKTDLLLHKANDLQMEMRKNKREKSKILYLVANGSPKYPDTNKSLFFYRIKDFFKKSSIVDVITVTLEEESSADMESSISELRRMMERENYGHAFVDEYWIGSKPAEHMIMIELIDKINLKGYVWITSIFDYSVQPKHTERISGRTGPLLAKLREKGGVVSRLATVLRPGNSIVQLVSGYSELYSERSYPYGTKQILGHSFEGWPITWTVEKDVDGMYTACANIVDNTIRSAFKSYEDLKRDKLTLNPHDILVVNFAIRMDANANLSLEELFYARNVPFLTFGESTEHFKIRDSRKVTLLQSLTRDASSYLDGVEWPMVIVILPSSMLLNTAKLAKGAQNLRNYDTYISFFRTMVKLVVISDKWENGKDFLTDVARKDK